MAITNLNEFIITFEYFESKKCAVAGNKCISPGAIPRART